MGLLKKKKHTNSSLKRIFQIIVIQSICMANNRNFEDEFHKNKAPYQSTQTSFLII